MAGGELVWEGQGPGSAGEAEKAGQAGAHEPMAGASQNRGKHEAMEHDFFIVHVLALLPLIFKVTFMLFSNMVTSAENQGITLNILNQTAFISSSFCTVYFNIDPLKTC